MKTPTTERKRVRQASFLLVIAFFATLILGQIALADWETMTVDSSSPLVGQDTSLALDSSNLPHISYYDGTNEKLKYAWWGVPDNGIAIPGWQAETVDSGKLGLDSSLALDSNGYPHISYYDYGNDSLKYAWKDSSGWHTVTVDSSGLVGVDPSLVLDSSGYPHISYYDYDNKNLKLAWEDSTGWNTTVVDNAASVGRFSSLALDSNGYPHISYYDAGNDDLKYAWENSSGWQTTTVASSGNVGRFNSLNLNALGNPQITYYASSPDNSLKYAEYVLDSSGVNIGFKWEYTTIDSTGDVGRYSSLGSGGVSYYDKDTGSLKFAKHARTGWYTATIDSSSGVVGWYTSTAGDPTGGYHVSYYDESNGNLKYARFHPDKIATFNNGTWWVDMNNNGTWDGKSTDKKITGYGNSSNRVAIGDLDYDGVDEIATFDDGTWYIDANNNDKWDGSSTDKKITGFGNDPNKVVAADFDGDGKDEIATFNNGTWWKDMNNNGKWDGEPTDEKVEGYGNAKNQVAAADFDGDGKGEIATFNGGTWWKDMNNNGKWDGEPTDEKVEGYGTANNKVAAGDIRGTLFSGPANATAKPNLDPTKGLTISSALAYPNPVKRTNQVTFRISGQNIRAAKLHVFSASGSEVFSTDYVDGRTLTWDISSGVSNGIYLYSLEVKGEGKTLASDVRKLLVLK